MTKALDALNDAIGRAQAATKAVRSDLGRSSLGTNLARDVERMVADLRRDAAKLDRAVRADIRKVTTAKPAAAKPAARKPAAKKPAARKPAAKVTAAKAAVKKAAAKPAAKKPAARKRAAKRA